MPPAETARGAGGIELAAATDRGRARPNNEDSFLLDPALGLLAVADGLGGHRSGEVASALAVSTIRDSARRLLAAAEPLPRALVLRRCVEDANAAVAAVGASREHAGMGTTVVAALLDSRALSVAHVGDSRLYLWRGGLLRRLTEDHSVAGRQNVLTRALGAGADVQPDLAEGELSPGDVVLLATDGLTNMLVDAEIAAELARGLEPRSLVEALVARALEAGGLDNVTVAAARVP